MIAGLIELLRHCSIYMMMPKNQNEDFVCRRIKAKERHALHFNWEQCCTFTADCVAVKSAKIVLKIHLS